MKNAYRLLVILLFNTLITSAKDRYIWPEFSTPEIPDSVKNEDAIYFENRITIDFRQSFETSLVQFKRIKIMSKKGVEDFINHDFFEFNDGNIVLKQARIIKPDNSIIELTDEQILETFINRKKQKHSEYIRRIQFIFPNLEVNDIIDVVYKVDYNDYSYSNCIYLEDDLYSLNSRLTFRNLSKFDLTFYPSKNLTDYRQFSDDGIPTFYWNVQGVRKNIKTLFSAHNPDASKIAYTLWLPEQELTYPEVYSRDWERFHVGIGTLNFPKYLYTNGILSEAFGPVENLNNLIRYMEENFSWNPDNNAPETTKAFDYFNQNRIDRKNFFRLIQEFLDKQKIKYQVGYTRNINAGYFEHGLVALYQLQHRYLLIENVDGSEHFLFAPDGIDQMYYLNEIPYYCEGNESILFEGSPQKMKTNMLKLPQSDFNTNKNTATLSLGFRKLADPEITILRRDIFSGQQSVLLRNPQSNELFQSLHISDEILRPEEEKDVYPYQLVFKCEDTVASCISQFDEELYAFSADSLVPDFVFFTEENEEPIGDYSIIPYSKHQKYTIYLKSESELTIADELTTISESNAVGYVKTEIIQTNPNTLKVTYEIKLEKRILENTAENKAFQDLINGWHTLVGKKWIIREKQQ